MKAIPFTKAVGVSLAVSLAALLGGCTVATGEPTQAEPGSPTEAAPTEPVNPGATQTRPAHPQAPHRELANPCTRDCGLYFRLCENGCGGDMSCIQECSDACDACVLQCEGYG